NARDSKLTSAPLAARTVVGRALALADRAYRTAAAAAGFTLPAVHEIALLEVAKAAVGMAPVAQAAATRFDRLPQRFLNGRHQNGVTLQADFPRRRPRVDACPKQRLVGVDVADAGDDAAVHQCFLDACAPPAREAIKP